MQKAFSFDRESVKKILKGLLIACTGGAALGGLQYLGTVEINNLILAQVVTVLVPVLVNGVKEYIKGE
jgi:hypothetical protein